MFRQFAILAGTAAWLAQPATAQDVNAAAILEEAQSHLHLTCNTLVELHGDDNDKILDVIALMVAVSLNNRGIDFLSLDLTEQETAEIRAEFADQIGDACADDADQLMAGVVDRVTADLVLYY